MNNTPNSIFKLKDRVRLTVRMVPDRDPWCRVGSIGTVVEKSVVGVRIRFDNGERWCWPDELEVQ